MTAKWGEITAGEIVGATQGELLSGSTESALAGLSTDTRSMIPGQLFWALKGERYDGHDFVNQAVERGATGVVIQENYRSRIPSAGDLVIIAVKDTLRGLGDLARWWRHEYPIQVAAITGSVGKTTTKEMAAGILAMGSMTLRNKGNFNNLVGLPLTLLSLQETHQKAVLEMGMNRPGEIARLTEIADPDVGLITNVGRAHIEGLGGVEGVARAKVELFQEMSENGQAVLNGDDSLLLSMASQIRKKLTTYGLGEKNDIRAHKIQGLGRDGTSFELQYPGGSEFIRLQVPGLQNVYNALAASAIAICMDEAPEHIVKGLRHFEGLEGRFKLTPLRGGVTLVDDTYNSNPVSLQVAINSLKDLALDGGRLIVCLGDMLELGDEAKGAHLEAGRMVAKLGAHHFVTMGEHALEMIEGAVKEGFLPHRAMVVNTHHEMVQKISEVMKDNDVILLKGSRRMHLEKVAEGLKAKFS